MDCEPAYGGLGVELVLSEEIARRDRADFHTKHLMSALVQPHHVAALAAQRHEHHRVGRKPKSGPELLELRIDPLLVEAD